ncbi:hypothetical protein BGZ99_000530 [Dissophora globulifera]|uniref:Uncharacterized protein n=1 Tax=Dissophora globulifera TaxID=979702 RepID=A0A9P6RU90_9FUNG|nr:hypothetical protein BGZ99_000530 [Dissophora globulifera]
MLKIPRSTSTSSLCSHTPSPSLVKLPSSSLCSSPALQPLRVLNAHASPQGQRLSSKSQQSGLESQQRRYFNAQQQQQPQQESTPIVTPNAHCSTAQGAIDCHDDNSHKLSTFINASAIQEPQPIIMKVEIERRNIVNAEYADQQQQPNYQQQRSSAGPFNHFFTPGAHFSPSCSRVGLSSSSSASAATEHRHNPPQFQVSADSNTQLSLPQNDRPRQRTPSHQGGDGPPNWVQDRPHLPSSKSSLFRPIFGLLAATTAASTLKSLEIESGHSNGFPKMTLNNDDLPSPIYNQESSDEEDGGERNRKGGKNRAVFAHVAPSESIQMLRSTAIPMAMVGSINGGEAYLEPGATETDLGSTSNFLFTGDKNDPRIDTPLLDLQERGYVSVKDIPKARDFEDEERPDILEKGVHRLDTDLQVRDQDQSADIDSIRAQRLQTTGHGESRSPQLMSASLDARYWGAPDFGSDTDDFEEALHQTNVSMENVTTEQLIDIQVQDSVDYAIVEQPQRRSTTVPALCLSDLVPIELKNIERQVEQEVDVYLDAEDEEVLVVDSDNDNNSPGWTAMVPFQPEFASCPANGMELGAIQESASSIPLLSTPAMKHQLVHDDFAPSVYPLLPLPTSQELGQGGDITDFEATAEQPHLLPPLPPSSTVTPEPVISSSLLSSPIFVTTDTLPLHPASPKCDTLLLLPPSHGKVPHVIITNNQDVSIKNASTGPISAIECRSPRSIELATARIQLEQWKQTATRLRDQEKVLTDRIDQLVQEIVDVLERCQDTEIGLEVREGAVYKLKQELIMEKEFGFVSVQEAALSIQEKQVLERALEDSWKELDLLRQGQLNDEQQQRRQDELVSQHIASVTSCALPLSQPDFISKGAVWSSGASFSFLAFIKYVCLTTISAVVFAAPILLLFGHQHQLHRAYYTFTTVAGQASTDLYYKINVEGLNGFIQRAVTNAVKTMTLVKTPAGLNDGSAMHALAERVLSVADTQLKSSSLWVQQMVALWKEADMKSIQIAYQFTRTWF